MADLGKIKVLLTEKGIKAKDLAYRIGITEQGLHKLIQQNSTKVDTLEKIAEVLEVPVTYFFDNSSKKDNPINDNINNRLLSIIESQQRTIENLTNK